MLSMYILYYYILLYYITTSIVYIIMITMLAVLSVNVSDVIDILHHVLQAGWSREAGGAIHQREHIYIRSATSCHIQTL